MRILVFDTETTGLPASKIINPDTLHLWPHIVQFSYLIYDTNTNEIIKTVDSIVKLNNDKIIPEESIKIHGITDEMSKTQGIQINLILNDFFYHLRNVDALIGHNVSFDINMIKIELLRIIYNNSSFHLKSKYDLHFLTNFKNITCTLQESIEICNIKAIDKYGRSYLKFPKLLELHQHLFESIPNNLHNSFNDILITLRCYMKLKYNKDLNNNCGKFIELSQSLKIF